jgi:adenylylsulfate kinase
MSKEAPHLVWHAHKVTREERAAQKQQKPCIVWLTGLSGSGKSTLANALEGEIYASGHHSYLLDGDNIRMGLNKGLGFSDADRVENIRRIGEVAKLFVDAGLIAITAFISPFRADRDMVRSIVGPDEFFEVYVRAPLEVCEQRDPKGMYKKARAGVIKQFTGIDSPYEEPLKPELVIDTAQHDLQQSTKLLLDALKQAGRLS